jgi:CheY-like chemotaxis protein
MPVDLFCSYSHKDEALREELDAHLALLRRRGVLNPWHDRRIAPSDDWKESIDSHLEAADIVLLLISPDFMASDYCYDVEMTRAIARHQSGATRVVPVIARSVDLEGAPFATIQALPKDAKPVTSWSNRDEAWTDVAKGIRKLAEAVATSQPPAPAPPSAPPAPGGAIPRGESKGIAAPADRPTVPPGYVGDEPDESELRVASALRRALTGFQQDMGTAMKSAIAQKRAPTGAWDASAAWGLGEQLAAIPGWKRILWVDDRPGNNAAEIAAFARLQIEVCTSLSSEDAIDALAKTAEPFDLVISDWRRPAEETDTPAGLRLLRDIRARGWAIPVIFYHGVLGKAALEARNALVAAEHGQGATDRPDELFAMATRLLASEPGAP